MNHCSQATSTSPSKWNERSVSWTVLSWFSAPWQVCRVRLQRLIGRCVGTTFLGFPSSTRWIGALPHTSLQHTGRLTKGRHSSPGANPWRVIGQIRQKLKIGAAAVQVPIGVEDNLRGVVDLVRWKAIYNQGEKGNQIVESDEIPAEVMELAKEKRRELIEQLAEVDEEMGELLIMDEDPTTPQLAEAIRRATISLKFSPVFLGSAIKNTAVQPMLDGVCAYLPTPSESKVTAHDTSLPVSAPPVELTPASAAPLVALAFKLEEGRFGQLTYMRVYQGTMRKGQFIYHARTGKKVKVPRLVRMHSNEMEVCPSCFLAVCVLTRHP